ncbi:hypothetical protein GCM10027036_34250 [Flavihumibacter cheonanensis]|uniref:hypothetical protein n=1 Tax=Flavihumibacter cheonanensis TaxID=1442385 RepID=UPI001EF7FD7D|nr:hypothetical protein [Flavihumibacter cheonanensis]MCG7754807.1 hypothetical protein [Flavihumibacter cheonanensis]
MHKAEITKNDSYEIKSMSGCCGCKAILYNVIRDSRIIEQFVVETYCGIFNPTKHLFTLDRKGRVIKIKSFVAVTDSSFTLPTTDIDKKAFLKLDSIYKEWIGLNKRQIKFADITGFRENGQTHMPLGVKLAKVTTK